VIGRPVGIWIKIHLNPKIEFRIYYWKYPHVQRDFERKTFRIRLGLVQNGIHYITYWLFEGGFPPARSDV
jgi:hypothetical protein